MNQIINIYKIAWETHDAELLRSIFHDDATYQEHHNTIFHGIEQISTYWIKNSNRQRDVSFEVIDWTTANGTLIIHWEASFLDIIQNKVDSLEGLMWVTVINGKIAKFIEFFEHRLP